MAQDTNVTALGFLLRVAGIVSLQHTVKANARKADELITALQSRVTALETALANSALDSNSQFSDSNSQF